MKSITDWLDSLHKIKESKLPKFKKHIASEKLSEHEANLYALFLLSITAFDGNLSKNQERLFQFYLPSVSEGLKLSELLSLTQDFDSSNLNTAIKLLEDNDLKCHFLLDLLIFSRIDGKVSNDKKEILDKLCQALFINKEDVEQVIYVSDQVLGINKEINVKSNDVIYQLISNDIWVEFYVQKINKSSVHNIDNGIWSLDSGLDYVEGDVSWSNCMVIFDNESSVAHYKGKMTLDNSILICPRFISTNVSLKVSDISVKGNYPEDKKITAFSVMSMIEDGFDISNSNFQTINARTFYFDCDAMDDSKFNNCIFYNCGNDHLLGGAVAHMKYSGKFNNCEFLNCHSYVGGAIFAERITIEGINNCRVDNCTSIKCWDNYRGYKPSEVSGNAGCIYILETRYEDKTIIGSFINTSISIRNIIKGFWGSSDAGPIIFESHGLNAVFNYHAEESYYLDKITDIDFEAKGISDISDISQLQYEVEHLEDAN